MFKLILEKTEEPEIKLAISTGSLKKQESSRKNIYFCFIDYAKDFDCVDHNKLWKILKEMGIPDHLTCLLRNLYAGQEATVRTRHGRTDLFQIGKGVPFSPSQIRGREHSPTCPQKIGLKIYTAWPHPSEEGPGSPWVSLKSQKTNQFDHMDQNLV